MAIGKTVSAVSSVFLIMTGVFASLNATAAEKAKHESGQKVYQNVVELPIAPGGLKLDRPLKLCRIEAKMIFASMDPAAIQASGNPLDKRLNASDRSNTRKTGEVGFLDFIVLDTSKKLLDLTYSVDFDAAIENGILRWRRLTPSDSQEVSAADFDPKQLSVPSEIVQSIRKADFRNVDFRVIGHDDRVVFFGVESDFEKSELAGGLSTYVRSLTSLQDGHLKFAISHHFIVVDGPNPTVVGSNAWVHMVAPQIEFDCY